MLRVKAKKSAKAMAQKKQQECDHEPKFRHVWSYDRWRKFMPYLRYAPVLQDKVESFETALHHAMCRNSEAFTQVVVGDATYQCHIGVLRCFSPIISELMDADKRIILPSCRVSSTAFEIIYQWMTHMKCCCYRSELLDILVAGRFMQSKPLLGSIFNCLGEKKWFSELDAFMCHLDASRRGINLVADLMLGRIGKTFLLLVATTQFRDLRPEYVCTLLQSNQLGVQTEVEVLYAAVLWATHNDKRHYSMIFGAVRFKLMSSHFLLHWAEHMHELDLAIADSMCPYVHQAMLFHHELYMRNFDTDQLAPFDRVWLWDKECPYTLALQQERHVDITFSTFLKYLKNIRRAPNSYLNRIRVLEFNDNDFKEEKQLIAKYNYSKWTSTTKFITES